MDMGDAGKRLRGTAWGGLLSLLHGSERPVSREDDPSHLTLFPLPGERARPASVKEFSPNALADEDARAWEQQLCDTEKGRSSGERFASQLAVLPESAAQGETAEDRHAVRDYWMPDRLCKICYECEQPFNMFRRKHHCRFCGQVFCHSCASYFVDGKSVSLLGMVRACKVCHQQVALLPQASAPPFQQTSLAPQQQQTATTTKRTQRATASAQQAQAAAHRAVSSVSKLVDRPSTNAANAANANASSRVSSLDARAAGDATAKRSPTIGSRFEEPGNRAAYDGRSLTALHGMDLQQDFEEDGTSSPAPEKGAAQADAGQAEEGALAEANSEASTSEANSFVKSEPQVSSHQSQQHLARGPVKTLEASNRCFKESVEGTLRSRLLGASSQSAPHSVLSANANLESTPQLAHHRHKLSIAAATHLEQMVDSLVRTDQAGPDPLSTSWTPIVLALVKQACDSVVPNVRAGDHIDIRPYVKIKTVPGGLARECCYVDGLVFRKNVVHKLMARACRSPRILLMSGGIEFQRTLTKLATFDTLMEQEQRYTQIMVEKIVRLQPDLLLVGHSVSRQAQEYLHQHEVIVIQHVKPELLQRVARMTGAAVLSSTDHLSMKGSAAVGVCQRFQMVAFPSPTLEQHEEPEQSHHTHDEPRQMKRVRGHGYCTLVYLAGCPQELGCTLVLRGATKSVLRRVKRITRFAISVAYHLRLETAFLLDCGAEICQQDPRHEKDPLLSSSLAVSFGAYDDTQHHEAASAYDHQSLLVTSVWMSQHQQCASAEVKAILYYTPQDVCLGQFLLDSCFNLDLKFPHGDKRSVLDITQIFNHNDGRLTITVVKLDQPLPGSQPLSIATDASYGEQQLNYERSIVMWCYCRECERIVTPLVPMSDDTWKMSFGKFLEICFYNSTARGRTGGCTHQVQRNHVRFFGCGNLAARLEYEKIELYGIFIRTGLRLDQEFHDRKVHQQYAQLGQLSRELFAAFCAKKQELELLLQQATASELLQQGASTQTAVRGLRGGAAAQQAHAVARGAACAGIEQPQFAQIVRSELALVGHELAQHSARLEKQLADALRGEKVQFPGKIRRKLYIAATHWNAVLSLLGHLLATIRDRAFADHALTQDQQRVGSEELVAAEMLRLQRVKDRRVAGTAVQAKPDSDELLVVDEHDFLTADPLETVQLELELLSGADEDSDILPQDTHQQDQVAPSSLDPEVLPEFPVPPPPCTEEVLEDGPPPTELDEDEDREDGLETVVAAVGTTTAAAAALERPRANCRSDSTSQLLDMMHSADASLARPPRHARASSTGSVSTGAVSFQHEQAAQGQQPSPVPQQLLSGDKKPRGYKISTAFARLMGKESPEEDPWAVQLGELEGGRPRLEVGDKGDVLLVHEEQPTTIIAYSLNTVEYKKALRTYLERENVAHEACSDDTARGANAATQQQEQQGPGGGLSSSGPLDTSNSSESLLTESFPNMPWAAAGLSLLIPEAALDSRLPSQVCEEDEGQCAAETSSQSSQSSSPPSLSRAVSCATTATLHSPPASPRSQASRSPPPPNTNARSFSEEASHPLPSPLERQLLSQHKTHVKHRFADADDKGNALCKFVCQAYWATQFAAVRKAYLGEGDDDEIGYLQSLSTARLWNAQGGKSGATFLKTTDGRFVVKQITRTELQMFLEYAPAYFEYLSKAFFHNYATLLVKVLGVYQIGSHNRVNGRRIMEQVVVMENLFHERSISHAFDLKGSTRSRYARVSSKESEDSEGHVKDGAQASPSATNKSHAVLLDENFMEFTRGRPLPLRDTAKAYFNSAVLNDTLFLSLINVVDYSILVGMDEENFELVVGIIDYMRQYDIIKKMERMGKSVGMIAGQAEPTVIQPPNYRNRFQSAMERYFMMVPDKFTVFRMQNATNFPMSAGHHRNTSEPVL